MLWFTEIRVSPEIRVLPSGALFQTLDSENFSTAPTVGEHDITK